MALENNLDRDMPTLFEVNYQEAAATVRDLAMFKASEVNKRQGKMPWQFINGFKAYGEGRPLARAIVECAYPDSRKQFRLGWLCAMFIDLNNRECIVMKREVHPDAF